MAIEIEEVEEMLDKEFISIETYARFLGLTVCKEV